MLQMGGTIDEERRKVGAHPAIVMPEQIELQAVGESDPAPFDICLRKPFAAELRKDRPDRVRCETMTDQKCRKWQQFVYSQRNASCALLNQFGHYRLEDLDFARPCGLIAAPRIGQIKHVAAGQSSGIHAAAIHYRLAEPVEDAPDVGMVGFGAVGQIEDFVLIIGQSGMDRVPLDPRFEIIGIGYIGYTGKYLRRLIESRKIGKLSLIYPPLQQRRTNLVEFQQKNLRHRPSPTRRE